MYGRLLRGAVLTFFLAMPAVATAEMLEVSGIGKAKITSNAAATKTEAIRNAKRNAVEEAIMKLVGPSAPNDPKVRAAIDKIVVQISDSKIVSSNGTKDNDNNYELRVTLRIDELEFTRLMQTQGIAPTGDRLYKILVVMDEYHTTPTDKQKPLKEVIEYSHDKTATSASSLSAAQSSASDTRAAARDSSSSSARYSAGGQSSGYASGGSYGAYGGGGYAAGGQSSGYAAGAARQKSSSSAEYSNQTAEASRLDTQSFDQQKNVVSFKKLVEYQPQNVGPDKENLTYAALMREARKFDLSMMDNSLLRSQYFRGKALTIQEMDNSPELANYVGFARKNKADYFMMGNTIIRDLGGNQCDGVVSLKAFSTEDSELLAADMHNESARGTSSDDCRATVANKLAYFVGKKLGSSIKDFHRQREVSGKEYTVVLISAVGDLTGRMTSSFSKGLQNMKGLNSKLNIRNSSNREYEVSMAYKGEVPFADALNDVLDTVPAMKQADYTVNGTRVEICLEGPKRCK
ncbi:MAG: hypothetical protein WCP10_04550 [Desulfuromonadales bacterium]